MTTALTPPRARDKTWIEDSVSGYLFRYYVDQPAPSQWVAVGLLFVTAQPVLLTTSDSCETGAIAGLRARVMERLSSEALETTTLAPSAART